MRRAIFYAITGALTLVWLWRVWPAAGADTDRPRSGRREDRATRAEARRAPRAPVSLESLLRPSGGLCGTEVQPPGPAEAVEIPSELRALTRGRPTPEQVAALQRDLGLERPPAADPGLLARSMLRDREAVERQLEGRLDRGDSRPWSQRVKLLGELGRGNEALEAARTYATWPGTDSTIWLAVTLDESGQPAEAKRILEAERSRTGGPEQRAWLDAQLGFICATRRELGCAARAAQSLEQEGGNPMLASFTRAVELTYLGRYDEARTAYEKSLALDHDAITLSNLGEVENCAGRTEAGRARYLEALALPRGLDVTTSALSGLAYADLREGDTVSAWLYGAAALAGAGDGAHASVPRGVLALAALTGGDLAEAREQARQAHVTNPHDDLVRRRCFASPAEEHAMQALAAEARGDRESAVQAWLAVARGGHQSLSLAARRALAEICQ